jgi:plasmid stabilization system protein ParE
MGRLREELAEGLRSSGVPPYIVFYRQVPGGIAVARVLHGRRNITSDMFE